MMEYVFGVAAVWIIGTLPATYIAARTSPDWEVDEFSMHTEDRVFLFVLFWPFVVAKRITFPVSRFVSRPFVWVYRAIWNKGERDA